MQCRVVTGGRMGRAATAYILLYALRTITQSILRVYTYVYKGTKIRQNRRTVAYSYSVLLFSSLSYTDALSCSDLLCPALTCNVLLCSSLTYSDLL